jgi:hypothetical protein
MKITKSTQLMKFIKEVLNEAHGARGLQAADGTTPDDLARDLLKKGILKLDPQRRGEEIQTAVLDLSIMGDDGPDFEDAVWNAVEQSIPDIESAPVQENKMKITKSQLMKVIKEELAKLVETDWDPRYGEPPAPAGSLGGYGDSTDLNADPEEPGTAGTGRSARWSAGYDDGIEGNKFHWAPPEDQEDPEYAAGWKEGKADRRIESMRPV